ncbi:MAG: peptidylprolyl isomerase, partial [Phycisphaerae bacterium]|nr:peptidylprolyl isomerase [Phycisphaerae bacterium]
APIKNEANNGLANKRGSISMARTDQPDTATSQFFLNLKDNRQLDRNDFSAGYAVFGQIVRGEEVIDIIARIPTTKKPATVLGGKPFLMSDVPTETVTITKARRVTAAEAAPATTPATPPAAPPAAPPASPTPPPAKDR